MCTCIGRLFFCLALIITTLPVYIIVKINVLIACVCKCYWPFVHASTKVMLAWAWWTFTKLICCFFRLSTEGVSEMNASLAANSGKPRLIIMNHSSFMDALVVMTILSGRVARDLKSLASAHLFKMPILGGLSEGAGHFAVPFKSQATEKTEAVEGDAPTGSVADFSVDKDKVAKVMDAFEDWVKTGHVGAWFPEGRLNPNPQQMQTFRAGGFKIAVNVDCEVWCAVYAGFEVFWNRKAPIGGAPANCRGECFKLCSSSHELLKELAKGEEVDDKQKCLLLANHAQARFQAKRDEFTADPWVSKLPAKETDAVALVEQKS